jgi:signal recognition particle subunit SRP54
MQTQARGKGKKGKKGKGGGGARRPMGAPGALPGGFPAVPGSGMPGGMPSLPPGQGLPDLSKLNFDQFKDERRGQ